MAGAMPTVQEMHDEIGTAVTEYRARLEEIEQRGDGETAEDTAALAAIDERITQLQDTIAERQAADNARAAELERIAAAEADVADAYRSRPGLAAGAGSTGDAPAAVVDVRDREAEAFRALFGKPVGSSEVFTGVAGELGTRSNNNPFAAGTGGLELHRGAGIATRDLGIAQPGGTTGGQTVGSTFVAQLILKLQEVSPIRNWVRVITTSRGEAMTWPRHTGHPTAEWLDERATFNASEPTYDQVTFNAWKSGLLSNISNELVQDSAIDIVGHVVSEAGLAIGQLQNAAFLTGDGTSKPTGLASSATVGITAAATNTVTADEMIDLSYSVITPYLPNAVYYVARSLEQVMRKLKDSQGQYLWSPSLMAGAPAMFNGYPVVVDTQMPTPAASARSAVFGDLRAAYMIRDTLQVEVMRSDHYLFDTDAVSFRTRARTDGKLVQGDAVRALEMAAT